MSSSSSSWPALILRAPSAATGGAAEEEPRPSPPPADAAAPPSTRGRRRWWGGGGGRARAGEEHAQTPARNHGRRRRKETTVAADATNADADANANANADARPTVESFGTKDQRIIVATPPDGFLFDLRLCARVPYPPADVFAVLADEQAHRIFRGIQETVSHDVLSDDGRGKRALVVAHKAGLKFLGLTAAFETRLRIDEDRRGGTIRFRGADDGEAGGGGDAFMRRFEGSWRVEPFTEKALSRAFGGGGNQGDDDPQQQGAFGGGLGSLMELLGIGDRGGGADAKAGVCLVSLEQKLAPRLTPPRPVQPLVRALCGRTLQHMVQDLKEELGRRERERRRQQEKGGGR